MSFLVARDITKVYRMGSRGQIRALDEINCSIEQGSWTVITGPSGSGKSTLLNLLALLNRPTQGQVLLTDKEISNAPDTEQARLRRERFGIIFQDYQLLPCLTAWQNVALPLVPLELDRSQRKAKALKLLSRFGLTDRAYHLPFQLSGGEQQRVAVARALVGGADIIFADEPTSNVDAASADEILSFFDTLHEQGQTLVVASHDPALIKRSGRELKLSEGKLIT